VKNCLSTAFDDIGYSYLNFFLTDPIQPVILQNPNWHDIGYSYLNFFLTDPTQPVILQNPNWHDKLINIDLDNIAYGFNKIDIDTFRSHFGKPFVF